MECLLAPAFPGACGSPMLCWVRPVTALKDLVFQERRIDLENVFEQLATIVIMLCVWLRPEDTSYKKVSQRGDINSQVTWDQVNG